MRRDDDYIRDLMLKLEARENALYHCRLTESFPGRFHNEKEYYHVRLLVDSGFLERENPVHDMYRMTNAGHDFCAAIRDDTIWRKTKDASASVAGVSLGVLKDIGVGYLRAKLTDLGVPLG